jgi:hypothetical protein
MATDMEVSFGFLRSIPGLFGIVIVIVSNNLTNI